MGIRVSNIIGNSERIAQRTAIETEATQRRKFDTDYDPNKPPVVSSEKNVFGALREGGAKRSAVRYCYVETIWGYRADVIGPFHSKLYGTCAFGRSRESAKAKLEISLAKNFGFIGTTLLSDKDEADTVGLPDRNQAYTNSSARPITLQEACGTAGQ